MISSFTLLSHGCFHYLPPICTVGMLGSFTVLIMSDLTCQVTLTALKPKWPHKSCKKRLGCFAVVTHYIPLLIVTKSNLLGGETISHQTPQGITAVHKADTFCQPTSSSKMCRVRQVSGHPSSPQLVIPVTSLYKEFGKRERKRAFPLAFNLMKGLKVQ